MTDSSKRNNSERVPHLHREPEQHAVYLFRKLSRLLRANRTSPDVKSVHALRTTVRRIETLATSLGEDSAKPFVKFEKALREIFDRAGRIRDLDVQITALETISLPSVEDDKRVLRNYFERQRAKHARKLASLVNSELSSRLPRRQRRAKALLLQVVQDRAIDAAQPVLDLRKEVTPLLGKLHTGHFDTATLHELRLEVKHVRYAAEAAGEGGTSMVALLKPVQDAIGVWHDWINLINTADKVLGPLPGHPLMTVLRGKIRGRFNDAVALLRPLEAQLSGILHVGKRPGPMLVAPKVPLAAAANAG